jgi:hypothetical protein
MIKLKSILSEGYAWEREAGKPLPTLADTTAAHAAKLAEQSAEQAISNPMETPLKESDDIFDEIAAELGISSEAFDEAANKSMAELDIIEKIYMSDHYTKSEAMSMIADMLDVDINEAADGVKPDYIDADGDGNEEESMKQAFADKADKEDMKEAFERRMRGNLKGSEHILTETFRK